MKLTKKNLAEVFNRIRDELDDKAEVCLALSEFDIEVCERCGRVVASHTMVIGGLCGKNTPWVLCNDCRDEAAEKVRGVWYTKK